MKGLTKLTAVILCAIMAVAAMPLGAFAAEPYCEIKLKEGFKTEILPGESVELYLDYDLGDYQSCSFHWNVNGAETNSYKSLGFARDGIRVTAVSHGTIKVKMSIISNNQIVASDEFHITVLDTRTDLEKFQDKLKETNLGLKMGFGMFVAGPILAILAAPVLYILDFFGELPW